MLQGLGLDGRARRAAGAHVGRAGAAGCGYAAVGVATHTTGATPACSEQISAPDHGSIGPDDGWMWVDRSQWPVRYGFHGDTRWAGETRCTRPDGTVTLHPSAGGEWAERNGGTFRGDRFAGETTTSYPRAWALQKVP